MILGSARLIDPEPDDQDLLVQKTISGPISPALTGSPFSICENEDNENNSPVSRLMSSSTPDTELVELEDTIRATRLVDKYSDSKKYQGTGLNLMQDLKKSQVKFSVAKTNQQVNNRIQITKVVSDVTQKPISENTNGLDSDSRQAKNRIKAPLDSVAEKTHNDLSDPKSMFNVNGTIYRKIDMIGKGGSCKVYKVISGDRVFALKKVKLRAHDESVADGYKNEIDILKKLKLHPRIIAMIEYEINIAGELLIVLEYGEIDFEHMLRRGDDSKSLNFIRLYWEQMLQAVNAIHSMNIIHSDLKPAVCSLII